MAGKRGGRRPGAGRPKGARSRATKSEKLSLADLAKQHTEAALNALVHVMTKSESDAARVSAANALLDRAYGKPSQAVQHTGRNGGPIQTIDLTNATDEQLDALEALIGPLADPSADPEGGDPEGA